MLDILGFEARSKLHLEAALDKSPETISLDLCEMDPTHLSAIAHHFQRTIESLLGNNAPAAFPNINQMDTKVLRETYGASVFICRYVNCVRNIDGFETSSQRDKHESHHHRRYQCAHFSCAYFTIGFVTRALLNKHNKKYHALAMKEESPSLAEILAPKPEPLFMNALPVDDQPFGEVEFNNSSNGYLDVSTDFDFDKFINGSTGGGDNINFDPYLGENEINHSI